jgi:transposase InsO family protein
LFAVVAWASRRVLAWRLSTTLTTDFCLDAVQEAIARYGTPAIFTTDQGCQFTSQEFTGLLKDPGIQIRMDGKGCWRENVFVERLWKSLPYEEVYLYAYETASAAQQGLECDLTFYNQSRPHRRLMGTHRMKCILATCPHGAPPRRQNTARRHVRNGPCCPIKGGHLSEPSPLTYIPHDLILLLRHRHSQLDEQGADGTTLFERDRVCMVFPSGSTSRIF